MLWLESRVSSGENVPRRRGFKELPSVGPMLGQHMHRTEYPAINNSLAKLQFNLVQFHDLKCPQWI